MADACACQWNGDELISPCETHKPFFDSLLAWVEKQKR